VDLEMQVINLRTYAPNRCAVAPCQPKTGFAMIEERVPTPIEQPMHVAAQRWNPAWIIAMEAIGQVDKANAVAPVAERGHRNTASLCRRPLKCGTGIGSVRCVGSGQRHARAIRRIKTRLKMRQAPNC